MSSHTDNGLPITELKGTESYALAGKEFKIAVLRKLSYKKQIIQ